jgi:GNAT superfamily N-acetyltransferase
MMFVVRQGDDIVGMRGLYGTCWTVGPGATPVVVPQADDLVIDPAHRNRGLFLLLHRAMVAAAAERGFPAIVSLSGVPTTQELSLVCGYRELGDLDKVRRPITAPLPRVRKASGRAIRFARRRGAPRSGLVMNEICRGLDGGANMQITSRPDLEGMSTLAESTARGTFRAVRSTEFFRWRFGDPDRVYRFVYWSDSRLRGYLVLAWDPRAPHRVQIDDHAAEDNDVLADMFDVLRQRDDVEYLMMSATLTAEQHECARNAGFVTPNVSDDARRRFLYFPIEPSGDLGAMDGQTNRFPDAWTVALLD